MKATGDRRFDLSKPPLMHLTLIQRAEGVYEFIWSVHHLLLDGWSISLLFNELMLCYEAFSRSEEPRLEGTRPFRDYIAWLQQQDLSKAEALWRQTLKGFTAPTPLGVDRLASELPKNRRNYERHQVYLSSATTDALESFLRQHRLTMNTLVQGAGRVRLCGNVVRCTHGCRACHVP